MADHAARTTVVAGCALLLVACSAAPADDRTADRSVLASRPTADRAAATLNNTRRELLTVVATSAGGLEWTIAADGTSRECGPPLDGLGGQVRVLGDSTSPTPVLAVWPAVLASATHSAESNGYAVADAGPDRVRFVAADGASLELSTDASGTTVRAATGCHPVT